MQAITVFNKTKKFEKYLKNKLAKMNIKVIDWKDEGYGYLLFLNIESDVNLIELKNFIRSEKDIDSNIETF